MAKNKKKQFGDTKHFCPVAYKDNYVLWPGNPEVAAKYREKVYYFNNSDNRDLFLAEPLTFVAKRKPFVVSILLVISVFYLLGINFTYLFFILFLMFIDILTFAN